MLLVIAASLLSCFDEKQEAQMVQLRHDRMAALVKPGMQIDEAISLLKGAGFSVGEKYFPTEAKDYIQVEVLLLDRLPKSGTLAETIGKGSGLKIYGVIKAGSSGEIFEVD
jgi:hypothetical protein